jgi:hypothetical protein
MQARFRVSSMTDDEVQRNLSILRRRYSPATDDSSATLGALSALFGENTRLGATPHISSLSVSPSMDTPPSQLLALSSSDRSQTVSPIRLASLSPVTPARPDASHSPSSSGNLTAAAAGLGAASLTFDSGRVAEMNELQAQLWDEWRHDLRLELQSLAKTSDSEDLLRAELLRFKLTCAAQEKRIQELESVRTQGSQFLPSLSPDLPAQPSLVIQNSIVPDEPAGYIDSRLVDSLRELGFLEDQARQAFSQSNNNLAVAADIVMQSLDNTTPRVRFDESVRLDETRLRVPVMSSRGRGCGGYTFTQPPRPGQMYESQTVQTRPPAVSQSVTTHHDQIRDQLPPVLDKLADSLSDLKNTMSSLAAGSATRESQPRDAGKRLPVSGRKFDDSKITQFNGLCELGPFDEYWLRPGAWTRKFRREMLVCGVPLSFWTHYALLSCGDVVTKLWEKEFETPDNVEPDWQPALLLEIQDDGGEFPYTHRREWPFFVC